MRGLRDPKAGRSVGATMQTAIEQQAVAIEPNEGKGTEMAQDRNTAALRREAEHLRQQLATEKERVRTLQSANDSVSKRLNAAIESVKAILARQG